MFLIFNWLILFRFSFQVESNERNYKVPFAYGFESGGHYSIKIRNYEEDNFIFMILKANEKDRFLLEQDLYHPCNPSIPLDYYYVTKLNISNNLMSGYTHEKGMFQTIVYSCNYFHKNFSFELTYQNPKSFFGYDTQNILILSPIIAIISFTIFIFWFIIYVRNKLWRKKFNSMYSISCFFFVLQKIFYTFESYEKNLSENSTYYQNIREKMQLFHLTYLLSSFLSSVCSLNSNLYRKFEFLISFIFVICSFNSARWIVKEDFYNGTVRIFIYGFISNVFWIGLYIFTCLSSNYGGNDFLDFFTFIWLVFIFLFYPFYLEENTFVFDYLYVLFADLLYLILLVLVGFSFYVAT